MDFKQTAQTPLNKTLFEDDRDYDTLPSLKKGPALASKLDKDGISDIIRHEMFSVKSPKVQLKKVDTSPFASA